MHNQQQLGETKRLDGAEQDIPAIGNLLSPLLVSPGANENEGLLLAWVG
jgi:hypothetical protein